MQTTLEVLEFIAGAAIVTMALLSAVRSTILPRAVQSLIVTAAVGSVRAVFRLRVKRISSYEGRDRATAILGPVALLATLAVWVALIMFGFTLMFHAFTGRSFDGSFELSGSSVFTLGSVSDSLLGAQVLSFVEAGLGLLIVALLITYLPVIYGAFSRRENGVALLQVRAGSPPRSTNMMIRYIRIEEGRFRLTELWRQWETWFVDVEETHTTFPILVFFRSSHPERNWVTAAGALLDGASFWASSFEHPKDPDVQLCIRAGYLALRRIADVFHVYYEADPAPDDPISISREEWEQAMDEMAAAGASLIADREQAWKDWKGWRVNYDTVLLGLARLVEAPPTPWVSDRSPLQGDPRWRERAAAAATEALRRLPGVGSGPQEGSGARGSGAQGSGSGPGR